MTKLFATAAVFSFAAAVYFMIRPEPESPKGTVGNPEPAFIIEPIDQDLGRVRVGLRSVVYEITNLADRPRRIIGNAEM